MGMTSSLGGRRVRTIALEEAFLHPALWRLYPPSLRKEYAILYDRLLDVGGDRIRRMDAAGVDVEVLSHVQPGVQAIDEPVKAMRLAREVNDWLADAIKSYPTRLLGFATLPMQSPQNAADELERTVTDLAFKGALINGHTNERYLDDECFSVVLERAQALDVPIYLHPTDPPRALANVYYRSHRGMVNGWGWPVETGTHLLRMMVGGVFDRHPRLKIIVGHMGELIPYCLTRLNIAMTMGDWLLAGQADELAPRPRRRMERSIKHYMRQNVFVTTSGVFDQPVFDLARAVLGIDNLLFSIDEPMRDSFEAVEFLNHTHLSTEDREKLAHGNAERLLKLPPSTGPFAGPAHSSIERLRASANTLLAKAKSRLGRMLVSWILK